MEEAILNSDVIIAICSQNSLNSDPIKNELDLAIYNNKKIIPIFRSIEDVRSFIAPMRGIHYEEENFVKFITNLYSIITGDLENELISRNSHIERGFEKLKKLVRNLIKTKGKMSMQFALQFHRSENWLDYFGCSTRKKRTY